MAKNFSHEGKTINWTNETGATVLSGQVFKIGGGSRHAVAITDIEDGQVGAGYRCGVWKFPPNAGALSAGDDFTFNVETQLFDAGGAVIGEVDEVSSNGTVHVLINGLPGTASNR